MKTIYQHLDRTGTGPDAVTAHLERGCTVIATKDARRVLWVDAAGVRRVVAKGIESVVTGLALEDLTAAQLKALAKSKGVKTTGKKVDLVSRVRTALALDTK